MDVNGESTPIPTNPQGSSRKRKASKANIAGHEAASPLKRTHREDVFDPAPEDTRSGAQAASTNNERVSQFLQSIGRANRGNFPDALTTNHVPHGRFSSPMAASKQLHDARTALPAPRFGFPQRAHALPVTTHFINTIFPDNNEAPSSTRDDREYPLPEPVELLKMAGYIADDTQPALTIQEIAQKFPSRIDGRLPNTTLISIRISEALDKVYNPEVRIYVRKNQRTTTDLCGLTSRAARKFMSNTPIVAPNNYYGAHIPNLSTREGETSRDLEMASIEERTEAGETRQEDETDAAPFPQPPTPTQWLSIHRAKQAYEWSLWEAHVDAFFKEYYHPSGRPYTSHELRALGRRP